MDQGNQNGTKSARYFEKMKKKSIFVKKETPVEFPENKGYVNESCSNETTNKANFIKNETKNVLEKSEPKQKEKNYAGGRPQNDLVITNHSKNSSKDLKATGKTHKKNMDPEKSFARKTNNKALLKTQSNDVLNGLNEETFNFEDMINNSRFLELVQDLVNSFTSNSTLPAKDLQALKQSLIERTCHTFLVILNSCVEKTFSRVLNSDFLQELKKKPVEKKDACCQTLYPNFSEDKESQIQENIYIFP